MEQKNAAASTSALVLNTMLALTVIIAMVTCAAVGITIFWMANQILENSSVMLYSDTYQIDAAPAREGLLTDLSHSCWGQADDSPYISQILFCIEDAEQDYHIVIFETLPDSLPASVTSLEQYDNQVLQPMITQLTGLPNHASSATTLGQNAALVTAVSSFSHREATLCGMFFSLMIDGRYLSALCWAPNEQLSDAYAFFETCMDTLQPRVS